MLPFLSHWQILAVVLLTFDIERCLGILCYKCDSVTLPDCATNLNSNSLPTEQCNSAFACAMTIVDSVTYRGCSTNTPRGPEYYKTCSDNLCNSGVYPPGRLKCHQCSGKDCITAPTSKPTPCLYFYETDYCYTDVIDEVDAYRGCNSDTSRYPNVLSVMCDINGCNDLPGVSTLTCSKCDSAEGRGCKMNLFEINDAACNITNTTTCSVQALLGHETETCFVYHNLDRVIRGCTYDSGTLSLDQDHFEDCDSELCNKRCLKQQKCIVCDTTKDERCKSDPAALTTSTCQSAEVSSCNACEMADGTVQRGCGVPSAAEGARCNQCQEEGCNKLEFTKCYKCTTDESPNCAQWANPNIIGVENCEIAGADCVSAVSLNGKTIRGCESPQLKCNSTQSSCVTCSGSLCNSGVFPTMRLQCHYCDGREGCSEVTDRSRMQPCSQYTADDECFEFKSSKGTMVRGCKSDRRLYFECLLAGSSCRLCSGIGCNSTPVNRTAQLRCHKCSREDDACSWQQDNNNLVTCQNEVKFLSMESCYIRRYADGSTSRGCLLDEDSHSGSEEQEFMVQTCTDEGCNNISTISQKCIQCSGNVTEDGLCTKRIDEAIGSLCADGLVGYEKRGCYTRIKGEFVDRGCAIDLQNDELAVCQRGDFCHYCHGIECNSDVSLREIALRSSGGKLSYPSIGLLMMIYVLVCVK